MKLVTIQLSDSCYLQGSQRRIEFDEFSRNVSANRSCEDYQKALYQIQRNSSSRSLHKRLIDEQRERDIDECLRRVSRNVKSAQI